MSNEHPQYLQCWRCFKDLPLEVGERVMLHEECPSCGAGIHCCKMCEYYDTTAYNECHEPIAERVVHKDKANFCDLFSPKAHHERPTGPTRDEQLKAAAALFKN